MPFVGKLLKVKNPDYSGSITACNQPRRQAEETLKTKLEIDLKNLAYKFLSTHKNQQKISKKLKCSNAAMQQCSKKVKHSNVKQSNAATNTAILTVSAKVSAKVKNFKNRLKLYTQQKDIKL
jgi:hypothetical protein